MNDKPESVWVAVSHVSKTGLTVINGHHTKPVEFWQEYIRRDIHDASITRAEAAEAKLAYAMAALRLWKAAYRTCRNEPLVQAFENAEITLAELKGEKP